MNYRNLDLKVDQFIGYVNDGKINLIPPFQRGHVWKLPTRKRLIQNIVQGKPIPAIFLYREQRGDKYEYNILDGKQRLESLMLFIGNARPSLGVKNINNFFFATQAKKDANFSIAIDGKDTTLRELDAKLVPRSPGIRHSYDRNNSR